MNSMAATAAKLIEQRRFDEAQLTVDQILVLDPDNDLAKALQSVLAQVRRPATSPATAP